MSAPSATIICTHYKQHTNHKITSIACLRCFLAPLDMKSYGTHLQQAAQHANAFKSFWQHAALRLTLPLQQLRVQAGQGLCNTEERMHLLQALPALLFLLFPTHDPTAGLLALGGSKELHRAIRVLRATPAVLAFGEVPVPTMALLQHSPYLVTLGEQLQSGMLSLLFSHYQGEQD